MSFTFGFISGFIASLGLALLWMLGRRRGATRTVSEVRRYLEEFLSGKGNPYDWDDFLSISIADPYLDSIRNRSNRLQGLYPPNKPGHWCSPEGEDILRCLIDDLRSHEAPASPIKSPKANKSCEATGDNVPR